MPDPLRYVIVGTGGFGGHWCRDVLPRLGDLGKAVPAAAVDRNPAALGNAREHLKLPPQRCYTDVRRALDEHRADFLVIVVPPAFHEEMVDLALSHDMHILCEKPIADTMPACCRIHRKVLAHGRKMAVTMSHRFDQDKQTLEHHIHSGEFGRLNYVLGRFTMNCRRFGSWGEFRHRIPDPLLVEGAVHHFDIYRGLTRSDAATVYAVTWNPPWGEYAGDSTGLITMQMANGVKCFWEGAKANASTLNAWTRDYLRAECQEGTLELDNRRLRALRSEGWESPVARDLPLLERSVWMNPWLAEMFCDWLLGSDPPPTHLEDNIQCAALLFAAVESAHTGRAVDVQEFLRRHQGLVRAP